MADPTIWAGEAATAKNRHARLHVRRPHLQLRHLLDRCRCDVLAGQLRRPGGMAADERGQDLPDRWSVDGRVAGDPLQRIDPAKPHIYLGMAELVDCPGKSLGDLPLPIQLVPLFGRCQGMLKLLAAELKLLLGRRRGLDELAAAELKLPVGDIGPHQQHHPAKPLQQGRADLVLGFEPLK